MTSGAASAGVAQSQEVEPAPVAQPQAALAPQADMQSVLAIMMTAARAPQPSKEQCHLELPGRALRAAISGKGKALKREVVRSRSTAG